MRPFALRTERWVIWNRTGWNKGWIALDFLDLRTAQGERRHIYAGIGFNGERFAQGSELARMQKGAPGQSEALLEFLRCELGDGCR